MLKINIITVVWGDIHTNIFTEIGLPSLLSDGNIPALSRTCDINYQIYTTNNDWEKIKKSNACTKLMNYTNIDRQCIDEASDVPHMIMSRYHKRGILYAYERKAYAVFIPPDCVWSNNSFINMKKIIDKDIDIVHITGLRLDYTKVKENLINGWRNKSQDTLDINSRELVKFGLKNIHEITKSHYFNEYDGYLMPANLFWSVNDTGILAHCFHLHPLVIKPSKRSMDFKSTIDDDLALVSYNKNYSEYIVSDSDEILTFEISHPAHKVLTNYKKGSIEDITTWAEIGTNNKHRELVKTHIRIHTDEINEKLWGDIEKNADYVINEVLEILNMTDLQLMLKHGNTLRARIYANSIRDPKIIRHRKKSIIIYFAKLIIMLRKVNSLIAKYYGHPSSIYFWHWKWCYKKECIVPLIVLINENLKGNILFVEDAKELIGGFFKIGHKTFNQNVTFLNGIDKLPFLNKTFNVILCANNSGIDSIYNNKNTFNNVLANDGDIYVLLKNKSTACIKDYIDVIGNNYSIVSNKCYGSVGTYYITKLFYYIHSTRLTRWIKAREEARFLPAKILLFPLIMPSYLLATFAAITLNMFGKSSEKCALHVIHIKNIQRSKSGSSDENEW